MVDTASEPTKKVTMLLPKLLVEQVTQHSQQSLTEIVREALRAQIRKQAAQELAGLRGKVTFSMTHQQLKALRD
jgi:hypothetical protein